MSVAVKRFSDVIEVLAESPHGATSAEVATTLGLGRQSAARMLSAMVANGLAVKDATSRRFRLGLRTYRWGTAAVARFVPPVFLRYEIAELADEIQHPVFYAVLDGNEVVTIERTQRRGRQILTIPEVRRNPWHSTSSGRALAAFQPEAETTSLLQKPGLTSRQEIEADLEQIRHQGYAASEAVRIEGYTLAAPVFDETGAAISAIGIGVNKHVPEEREVITRKLLETASRASSNAGFHAALLNA